MCVSYLLLCQQAQSVFFLLYFPIPDTELSLSVIACHPMQYDLYRRCYDNG